MKKANNRYFEEALNKVNESFFNAGGDFEFSSEDIYASGPGGTPSPAAQASSGNAAPTSQPYIINVTNTTGGDLYNVFVLGAYTYLNALNYGNPPGIVITYGLPNVTYSEFLWQTVAKPFKVGLTYIQSTNVTQVLSAITIQHKDANGNLATSPIVPIVDPYQQQSGNIAVRMSYTVDGFTLFTIADVSAGATLKLYLYPSEKVDLRRAVAGLGASTPYSAPRVSNQQKLTISAPTAQALQALS